jgi:hypothetical protein
MQECLSLVSLSRLVGQTLSLNTKILNCVQKSFITLDPCLFELVDETALDMSS